MFTVTRLPSPCLLANAAVAASASSSRYWLGSPKLVALRSFSDELVHPILSSRYPKARGVGCERIVAVAFVGMVTVVARGGDDDDVAIDLHPCSLCSKV